MHGAVDDVDERNRIIRHELVQIEAFAVPQLDVEPFRLELEVRCRIHSLDFFGKKSAISSFEEFYDVGCVDDAELALRYLYVILPSLFDLCEKCAADDESDKRINNFLLFIYNLDVRNFDFELPQQLI